MLIIKLGHSETLDPEISKECSLGDVVRTTVLLNYFKEGDKITWLVDERAADLLGGNPRIHRVLHWSFAACLQLQREQFDIVINLEKQRGVCALSDMIDARQKFGFYFGRWSGEAEAHYHTEKVLEIVHDTKKREQNKIYWQQHLAQVIQKKWSIKDKYILSGKSQAGYGIGLNFLVGEKWQDKAWERKNWDELYTKLSKEGYNIYWQGGQSNLWDYMDWIKSCACIITCDSLGMHLALAYGKKVVALFGPSPSQEVYMYDQGKIIKASDHKMESITVNEVLKETMEIYPLENKMDKGTVNRI